MIPRKLWPLLAVNFISTLSFSLVIPFLWILNDDFGGNAFIYGLLGATFSAFQIIGAPLLGRWSDRIGRRPVLLLSQAGTLLSWLFFVGVFFLAEIELFSFSGAVVGSFIITLPLLVMFLARAFDGITGGNVAVANAYLTDISTDKQRTRYFGYMAISGQFGFMIGPAVGGLLAATPMGPLAAVLAAVVVAFVGMIMIIFMLPESRDHNPEDQHDYRIGDIFRLQHIPFLLSMSFLVWLGFNFFYVGFPIWSLLPESKGGLGWSPLELGLLITFLSLAMGVVQGPVLGYVSKVLRPVWLILIGNALMVSFFVLLMTGETLVIYAGALLFAVGNGIMWPSLNGILSIHAGKDHVGGVMGFASSSGSFASIIGMIVGGTLFVYLGKYLFVISACIFGLLVVMSIYGFKLRAEHDKETTSVEAA